MKQRSIITLIYLDLKYRYLRNKYEQKYYQYKRLKNYFQEKENEYKEKFEKI